MSEQLDPSSCLKSTKDLLPQFSYAEGDRVIAGDRGNIGTVIEADARKLVNGGSGYLIEFVSEVGQRAEKWFRPQDLNPYSPEATVLKNSMPPQLLRPAREHVHSFNDILTWPEAGWIIDRLLPEKATVMLYGPSGSHKTFLLFDWCMHLTAGSTEWHGYGMTPNIGVVYVAAEGAWGFRKRMHAWIKHHDPNRNISKDALDRSTMIDVPVELLQPGRAQEFIDAIRFRMDAAKMKFDPKLVIFDTLSQCALGGDENSAKDMGAFVSAVNNFKREFDCTAAFSHHTSKYTKDARGSTVLHNNIDSVLYLERASSEDCVDSSQSIMSVKKMRDSRWERPIRIHFDEISFGTDQAVDICNPDSHRSLVVTKAARVGADEAYGGKLTEKALVTFLMDHFPEESGATLAELKNLVRSEKKKSDRTFYRVRKNCVDRGQISEMSVKGLGKRLVVTEAGKRLISQ